MGIFSKLMFWRKEEEPFPPPGGMPGADLGLPGEMPGMPGAEMPGMPGGEIPGMPKPGGEMPGMPEMGGVPEMPGAAAPPRLEEVSPAGPVHPSYRPPESAPAGPGATSGKDLEIISLKLDSLKTTLEAINERLARLEKMAEGGSESHRF